MSKEGKEIKITDKRMFTPEGQLREEYRFLEEKSTAAAQEATAAPPASPPPAAARSGQPAADRRPDRDAPSAPSPASSPSDTGAPPRSGRASRSGAAGRGETREAEPAGAGDVGASGASGVSGGGRAGGRAGDAGDSSDRDEFDDQGGSGARLELPTSPPGLGPSFYDLAAMLAEPVAIYLGDVELPDGQSAENLEMARLYIDLLDVLRQKTAGNLTAQESAFLEDLLYRLRVRYVQKRG